MSKVITLDGPTSSGKNSVGFLLSQKLGYQFIDSGSIFRVGTIRALEKNIDLEDEIALAELFKNLKIKFKTEAGEVRVYEGQEDLTDKLHAINISKNVPAIAKYKKVRVITKRIQKDVSSVQNTVLAGRDIGSVIFPDSKIKFFLTASPEVRAKRRFEQLHKKDPKITFTEVFDSMTERDEADTHRKESPLIIPVGAIIIDNTNLSVTESVEKMLQHC